MSDLKEKFNQFFAMEDDGDYEDGQDVSLENEAMTSYASNGNMDKQYVNRGSAKRDNLYALPNNSSAQVTVVEPRFFSEIETVGDLLLTQKIVVLNLHRAENKQAIRMIDFLNGVVFSIKGDIKRVGENIFVCTPPNVSLDDMENIPTADE